MKKILSIVMIAALCCMLFSCGGATSDFENAIANTNPTKTTITTTTTTELGELSGSFTVTYNDDGSAKITYSYEQWNKIGEGDEAKSTVEGTINKNADGTYSDGGSFTGTAAEITAGFTLNLEPIKGDAEINDAKDTLTATVSADDTEAVLGVAFEHDVVLEIVIHEGVVETAKVTFTDESNSGSITCKYE